jgi:hypothetical protein
VEPADKGIPLTDQLVVPAARPLPPRSVVQLTCVTPTLSDAFPPRLMVLVEAVKVEPEVGVIMMIAGGVGSGVL